MKLKTLWLDEPNETLASVAKKFNVDLAWLIKRNDIQDETKVRPGLQLVVDSMTEVPVLVLGRRMDVLAANPLARALYTDFDALPPHFRNMARLVFLHDHVRSVCTDWRAAAQGIVANLRLYAGRNPDKLEAVIAG